MSQTDTESMFWDQEGLERTHVSHGVEDKEILEALHSLDPCGEYDDNHFAERVQRFLKVYEKNARTNPAEETNLKLFSGISNSACEMNQETLIEPQSPEIKSGVARKYTVHFNDQVEEFESPTNKSQLTR